jgi:diguanylate cyclase (GGDEF)-like protein
MAPYWQTPRFRSLCAFFLLLLVLLLHRLRVRYLRRHNQRLQETVTQTRAELTLTARTARDAQEALKEQALRDGLTGLWNRRAVFAMLEKEIYRAQRDRFPVTLVMIDLDHFKNINDTFGHPTGDEVLREAARRLVEVMRPYDFIGRYGGEEFLVVLPSCSSHHGVQRAEEFRRVIATSPVITAVGLLAVTCSVGVAAYDEGMPPDDLILRADEALYRAKHMGRNCVCAGSPGKGPGRADGSHELHARNRARAG